MRVEALAVVKNESDIIEAFVRHNLQFVDSLTVVDNDSQDATPVILQRLQAEGLPLILASDDRKDHPQQHIATERVSTWSEETDWLFLLDADEFIEPMPGRELDTTLRSLRTDVCHVIRWESFVPTPGDDSSEPNPLSRITHRVEQLGYPWCSKLVIPRKFLGSGEYEVSAGNHMVLDSQGDRVPHREAVDLRLGHYPVRSVDQFRTKALIGHWAISSRAVRTLDEGRHWVELQDTLLSDSPFDREGLEQVAREYGVPQPLPELTLIEEPLRNQPDTPLRYLPENIDWRDLAVSFAHSHFADLRNTAFDSGGNTVIAKTRFGPMMYSRSDLVIGRSLKEYGEWAGPEIEFLLGLIQPGDVVLDIGANIGTHTVPMAQQIGVHGKLLAFEPQRLSYQMLCGNLALNNLTNTEAYREALGRKPGQVSVPIIERGNLGNVSSSAWGDGEPTPIRRLDGLKLPRVDLIKIDVEGMENEVLRGATRTIKRTRPILFVENNVPENSQKLISRVRSMGYRCWWHIEPYFNTNNFYRNPSNFLEGSVDRPELNMLCLPRGVEPPTGLEPVLSEDDTGLDAWHRSTSSILSAASTSGKTP